MPSIRCFSTLFVLLISASHVLGGVRILSLDGGGIRGLVPIKILQNIQDQNDGKPIHELFDVFIGTSAGGILATALGLLNMTLKECETLYRELGKKIFDRDQLSQWVGLFKEGASFNASALEEVLRDVLHDKLGFAAIKLSDRSIAYPWISRRVMLVSATAHSDMPDSYVYRNFNPKGRHVNIGSHEAQLFEALRSTSAAAYYFAAYNLKTDGGIVANNPSRAVLYELQASFGILPSDIDCLVSIGTGKISWKSSDPTLLSFKDKLVNLATDTERVHFGLSMEFNHPGLPMKYWRFNPPIEDIDLAETSDVKLRALMDKTESYIIHPEIKPMIHQLNQVLSKPLSSSGSSTPQPSSSRLGVPHQASSSGVISLSTTSDWEVATAGFSDEEDKCGDLRSRSGIMVSSMSRGFQQVALSHTITLMEESRLEFWVATCSASCSDPGIFIRYSVNAGKTWKNADSLAPKSYRNGFVWVSKNLPLEVVGKKMILRVEVDCPLRMLISDWKIVPKSYQTDDL